MSVQPAGSAVVTVPTVSIQVSGRMRVEGPGGVLEAPDLPGRQGRLVLASLAADDQPVARHVLAGRLWGERPPKAWERDLSAVVSKLRSLLARVGWPDTKVIESDGASYQLRLPAGGEVDVRVARWAVGAAAAALAEGRAPRAAVLARRAAAITGRPLLPGEDGNWIETLRAELAQLRLRALETTAEAAAAQGGWAEATRALEEVVRLEPFRETAHRRLMQVHLDAGDRAGALRGYERLRGLLTAELGVDPAPDTERVYLEALRATERSPSARAPAPPPSAATLVPSVPSVPSVPRVRYARTGRASVAYQVVGDGPVDVVLVLGWISNVELAWQEPHMAGFLRGLAESSRLLLFDKRGTGLSDPLPMDAPPPLEDRMDDVRAVMDAAGSEKAVVFGLSEGGVMSMLFAATHPERTAGLLLWGSWARQLRDADFPWGWTREEGLRRFVRPIQERGVVPAHWFAPSAAGTPAFEEWFGRYARQSSSPGMSIALLQANARMDVRPVLSTIRVPTLVLHRVDDVLVTVEQGRYLAEHIPGARLVELPGRDHWPWFGPDEPVLAEVRGFLARAAGSVPAPQRVLATVLAGSLPDGVDGDEVARRVAAHRGVLAEGPAGQLLARFDGPGRAVECALAVAREAAPGARVGIHTGEIEDAGERFEGLAVELAREVADHAGPGEVLVTRTVVDLVAGSPLRFAPRGAHRLSALDTDWELAATV